MSNSISTLYELNQSLADLGSKSDFEELNLGPLLKQPVVYDMFKAPQGLSQVPHVTTIQILKHLEKYMTKEDLWRKKVDLGKFMEYLSEEYQCGTPFDLGVRIQSIGLAISVMLLNFFSLTFLFLSLRSSLIKHAPYFTFRNHYCTSLGWPKGKYTISERAPIYSPATSF